MCKLCGYAGCLDGCPNAPEPFIVARCSICSSAIREYDEYKDFEEPICMDCVDNMTVEEAFKLCGYAVRRAEREEW